MVIAAHNLESPEFCIYRKGKGVNMSRKIVKTKNLPDPSRQEWLLVAIRALAASNFSRLVAGTPLLCPVRPLPTPHGKVEELPGHGRNRHPVPELCLALDGAAVLNFGDSLYDFAAPALAVIESDLWHCEARHAKTRAYTLMWVFPAKSSVHLIISRYRHPRRWDNPWSYSFHDPVVCELSNLLQASEKRSADHVEKLRAALIKVVAAVHADLLTHDNARTNDDRTQQMLRHVKNYLDTHWNQSISLRQVASTIPLAPTYLNSLFRCWQGKGIHAYLVERRMKEAFVLCKKSALSAKEVAAAVGFSDPLYFSKVFHKFHGIWPSAVRQK